MNIEIANRLVSLRKSHHLSQEELASKIGISRQAVSKWERAEASPDTDNLILLARLYQISLDELLKTEDPVESVNEIEEEKDIKTEEIKSGLKRKLLRFPYPIFITILFFICGYSMGGWGRLWILYLTIPVYYGIIRMMN